MAVEMKREILIDICKENGQYVTPYLNDNLYLQFKEYEGLKSLWLEGNGIIKIKGLERQTKLRFLYLQSNAIGKIEGLEDNIFLDTLNLSNNLICRVEGIRNLKNLTTLILSHNNLQSADDIEEIVHCTVLQTIDFQHNKISDPKVFEIFSKINNLRVLYLTGNPIVRLLPQYRKTLINCCSELRYLDERPVFSDERRRSTAWFAGNEKGGIDMANKFERIEIDQIEEERRSEVERQFHSFSLLVKQSREVHAPLSTAPACETDSLLKKSAEPQEEIFPIEISANLITCNQETLILPTANKLSCGEENVCTDEVVTRSEATNVVRMTCAEVKHIVSLTPVENAPDPATVEEDHFDQNGEIFVSAQSSLACGSAVTVETLSVTTDVNAVD